MEPDRIALGAAAAPAAAALVVLATFRLSGSRGSVGAAAWSVAAGMLAAFLGLEGAPALVPSEAWRWLPHLAVAGAAVATAESAGAGAAPWLRSALRVVAALFAAWASVLSRTPLWIGGVAAAIVVLIAAHDAAARRERAPPHTLVLSVTALAAAVSLFLAGTMRVAVHAGALAAAGGAAWAARAWLPAEPRGAVVPGGLVLAGLLLSGVLLAEMPPATAVLLALAPLGSFLPDRLAGGRDRASRAVLLRLATVTAIAAGAVAWAVHSAPSQEY